MSMLHFAAQCNICLFDIRKKIKIKIIKKSSNVQTLVEVEINVQTLIEVEVNVHKKQVHIALAFCEKQNPKMIFFCPNLFKIIVFIKFLNQTLSTQKC